jgi:predicted RNA-binding protein YlxR (DUF448 family)
LTAAPPRLRKCVGCGEERPKAELLRVVRASDGAVSIDASGKAQGRGAYVCADFECVRRAMKKNAFARALRHPIGGEIYARIEELCADRVSK